MSAARTLLDLVQGLAAGWAAAKVKGQAETTLQPLGERWFPPRPGQKELLGADPAGHGTRMPPSTMYVRLAARRGRHLDADDPGDAEAIEAGAVWFHRAIAYGYPVVYSLLSRRYPLVRTGRGAGGGLVLFTATHATTLPAAGLQAPVRELPRAWWVWEGGSHLLYGMTTDLSLRVLRRVTG